MTRLYVHNESTEPLVYTGWWRSDDPTVIAAGRTAWVPVRSGEDDCIEFSQEGRKRGYIIDTDAQMTGERTRYGSRINTTFRDGRLTVRGKSGAPLVLQVTEGCIDRLISQRKADISRRSDADPNYKVLGSGKAEWQVVADGAFLSPDRVLGASFWSGRF